MRRKEKTSTPGSRLRRQLLDVLRDEGYIRGYTLPITAMAGPSSR